MAGAKKNRAYDQQKEHHSAPPSSTRSSSNQSSSSPSTVASSCKSVKTVTSLPKSQISAQYDGPKDTTFHPSQGLQIRNLESLGVSIWAKYLGVSLLLSQPSRQILHVSSIS